jgi:FtsP/CotA-like multicopper oxidase with cupredoxin domain
MKKITILILFSILVLGCIQNQNKIQMQNTQTMILNSSEKIDIQTTKVQREINGKTVEMFAYNSQIPGPTIKVREGSKIKVNFTNNIDQQSTIHWHGIRLDNKFDGVPQITQKPVKEGESFEYELEFPDPGVYWYHPHVREEMQQELGLYGAIIVEPKSENYYNKADVEEVLFIDDILMDEKGIFPYLKETTNFALMGRYGNTYLLNGKENYQIKVKRGEVVRFFLINSANVRPINFSIEKTSMKIVGSDNGLYEKEFFQNSVTLTPSERSIIEVSFNKSGEYNLINQNKFGKNKMGKIIVEEGKNTPVEFSKLRENVEVKQNINKYRQYFDMPPNIEYRLRVENQGGMGMNMGGMMMHTDDGIEWEDTMQRPNSRSTNQTIRWIIEDKKTGRSNMDAILQIPKNRVVKISIENNLHMMHPMQHSIHFHGVRFLVVKENGKLNENMAWKDTVNIAAGERVELLMKFEREGEWMVHCHIAEHLSSDMMTSINVFQEE